MIFQTPIRELLTVASVFTLYVERLFTGFLLLLTLSHSFTQCLIHTESTKYAGVRHSIWCTHSPIWKIPKILNLYHLGCIHFHLLNTCKHCDNTCKYCDNTYKYWANTLNLFTCNCNTRKYCQNTCKFCSNFGEDFYILNINLRS